MRPIGLPLALLPVMLALSGCGLFKQSEPAPPQFAELMPVAMAQPMAAAAPAPMATAAPMAPSPMMTGPVFVGHLASYSKEADAIRGWDQIVRRQASIGTLKRYLIPITTPRGAMVRLIAGDFPTQDEANRFCTWAKQQSLYCAVMQIDADRKMAGPPPAPARPARPVRQPAMTPAAPAPMAPASPAPMAPPAGG